MLVRKKKKRNVAQQLKKHRTSSQYKTSKIYKKKKKEKSQSLASFFRALEKHSDDHGKKDVSQLITKMQEKKKRNIVDYDAYRRNIMDKGVCRSETNETWLSPFTVLICQQKLAEEESLHFFSLVGKKLQHWIIRRKLKVLEILK